MRLISARCIVFSLFLAACGSETPSPEGASGASGAGGVFSNGGSLGAAGSSSGVGGASGAGPGGALGSGGSGGAALAGSAGASGATAGNGGTKGGTSGAGGGGTGGSVAGGAGGTGGDADGTFSLVFRDDFDSLDSGRWQLMTHSWEGNIALFSASAAVVQGGQLVLRLTPAPSGTVDSGGAPKSFFGAEVRSRDTLTYGRVRARARLARGSAAVSALVTIYTPWPASNWNEFDIECLGKDPANVQFNAMVYTGPVVTPPVSSSVTPTQFPQLVGLGFDPSADFHVYTIEWTPAGARFLVDEQVRHTWNTRIDLMGLPQNVLLTIWASSSVAWAGAVTAETGQAVASYDWIELHRFVPR